MTKRSTKKNKAYGMTMGNAVISFIEQFCLIPEGSKVGQPLKLEKFQKNFILDIYDNKEITRRAIMAIARKNGKTALIASILLAHICGPMAKKNSQIVSGAMSRNQAALVFNLASKMINLNPILSEKTRIVPSGKMIVGLSKNVEYKAMAADGATSQGVSPVLAILDEVGQVKGPTSPFVEAIMTSQGAHNDALQIFISTQSATDADFFSVLIDDAIRSGDPKTVLHVYAADEHCLLLDEKQWKKANPALGTFRNKNDLEEQLKQASRLPSMESSARNLLLNQRISLESIWLAPGPWRECSQEPDLEIFKNNTVAIGLDLSARTDLTAAVVAAADESGVVSLLAYVFTPSSGLIERSQRDRAPYADWVRDGFMYAVPGSSIDYNYVAKIIRDDLHEKDIETDFICFDRWRIDLFQKACSDEGAFQYAQWLPVGQGYRDISPRMESFESKLLAKKIRHGSHPLLNMSASNAISTMDPSGNRKLDKSKSTLRIDPMIAAIMAVHQVSEGNTELDFDVSALIA